MEVSKLNNPIMNTYSVLVDGVSCSEECYITALEFSNGLSSSWPVECTLRLIELDLVHPDCGGKLNITRAKEKEAIR